MSPAAAASWDTRWTTREGRPQSVEWDTVEEAVRHGAQLLRDGVDSVDIWRDGRLVVQMGDG